MQWEIILILTIKVICDLLTILILLRIIVSWYTQNPSNILFRILRRITEPILAPLRRIIPRIGMIDLSPLVAVIIPQLIYFLFRYLL